MNDGTHSVVFLYEPAQDLAGRVPVPSPIRGRDKGGVERFGRFGHSRGRRHDRKVRFGLVDLSELEIHSSERGIGAAGRGCGRLPLLLDDEWLE